MSARKPGPRWTPFERGTLPEISEEHIRAVHATAVGSGFTLDDIRAQFECLKDDVIWMNSIYQINVRPVPSIYEGWPNMIHLSIKRRDKQPIHDWRHLQRIKNEIVGPEYEAIELYPAETRLVDSADQYHLWVLDKPGVRFPFGFRERFVSIAPVPGGSQRPFEAT